MCGVNTGLFEVGAGDVSNVVDGGGVEMVGVLSDERGDVSVVVLAVSCVNVVPDPLCDLVHFRGVTGYGALRFFAALLCHGREQ